MTGIDSSALKKTNLILLTAFSQVAGVLELLMGDVCQPFYYSALGLEQMVSKRRTLRVFFRFMNM